MLTLLRPRAGEQQERGLTRQQQQRECVARRASGRRRTLCVLQGLTPHPVTADCGNLLFILVEKGLQ